MLSKCHVARRLSTIEARLSLAKTGGKITFPQFLEMFRADLLDLKEIMQFLQMGSSAPTSETATLPEVCVCVLGCLMHLGLYYILSNSFGCLLAASPVAGFAPAHTWAFWLEETHPPCIHHILTAVCKGVLQPPCRAAQ